jgi:hypothetical protein
MKKFFVVYSTVICLLFAFKVVTGYSYFEKDSVKKWSPSGHNMHHK